MVLNLLGRWRRGDGGGEQPVAPPPPYLTLAGAAPAAAYRGFPDLPGSDPAVLARIGREGRAALAAHPTAVALPAAGVAMFLVPDFLSADECTQLIRLIDADVKPSTALKGAGQDRIRTSETCLLSPDEPVVAVVEARIAALLGQPLALSETVQGQRYHPGQFFRVHNDYNAGGQPYSDAFAHEGGQRTWTAMVFLDVPAKGGHTKFPRAGIEVLPRRGTLLTWDNMDAEGHGNVLSHHEGTPVIGGVKHVLTKWFRERPWSSSAGSDALRR